MDTAILEALDKELEGARRRLEPLAKKLAKATLAEQRRLEKKLGVVPTEWSADSKQTSYHATGQGCMVNRLVRDEAGRLLEIELVFGSLRTMPAPKKVKQ